jgi:hypothetical protein
MREAVGVFDSLAVHELSPALDESGALVASQKATATEV